MGLLRSGWYEKVMAKVESNWANMTEEQREAAYHEVTHEEALVEAFAVFEDGYRFYCHPDLIMSMVYSCKKIISKDGQWTDELQSRYDALEAKYKKYALKGVPPYEDEI